jgi:hypothetical protein
MQESYDRIIEYRIPKLQLSLHSQGVVNDADNVELFHIPGNDKTLLTKYQVR